MTVYSWPGLSRSVLADLLPEALVVLPIGAVEQHGPHLPTGTDAMLAETVAHGAARLADTDHASRHIVMSPTQVFGASDHHLAFGGTLSLTVETMHAVLLDLVRSVSTCGGRRLVIINGHGGNGGVMRASAAAASSQVGIAVAVIDYWDLVPADEIDCEGDVPGHAGAFETALMMAARPDLAVEPHARIDYPPTPAVPGTEIHSTRKWQGITGFTDNPGWARRGDGQKWLDQVVEACADRLGQLAAVL